MIRRGRGSFEPQS